MKIGTLSFAKRIDRFELSASERKEKIIERALTRQLELLVCAGWSVETFEDIDAIANELANSDSRTHLIVESQFDSLQGDHSNQKYHVVYLIHPNGRIVALGRQIFAQAKDIQGAQGQTKLAAFVASLAQRQDSIGNCGLVSLCCGEINILQGRDTVRCMSPIVEAALDSADIIVNPTHDLMGNHGTVIAKRRRLSRKIDGRDRIYISASNWDQAGYSLDKNGNSRPRRKQHPGSGMLHSVFLNGERQEMTFLCDGLDGSMYREWEQPHAA